LILCELLDLAEVEEHLSSRAEVHDKEELCLGLKGPVKLYYEGMIQLLHDHALIDDWLDLLFSGELVLPHDLHGVKTPRVLLPHEDDSTEGTSANHLDLLKVMTSHLLTALGALSESQLGEVSSKKLSILKHMERSKKGKITNKRLTCYITLASSRDFLACPGF
jgi:hypothetical protein